LDEDLSIAKGNFNFGILSIICFTGIVGAFFTLVCAALVTLTVAEAASLSYLYSSLRAFDYLIVYLAPLLEFLTIVRLGSMALV
jgi:hypothetical protein